MGWRVASEILTRKWKHVDFNAGFLRLEPGETKNGQGRMLPLIPELRAVLEAQRGYTDAVEREHGVIVPWVFHRAGERVVAFRRSWQKAVTAAGLPHLIPHDYWCSAGPQHRTRGRPTLHGDGPGGPPHRLDLHALRDRGRGDAERRRSEAGCSARGDPERRAPGGSDHPREGEHGALGQSTGKVWALCTTSTEPADEAEATDSL